MALLLQCLRDLRIMSGDVDLLPPPAGGESSGPDRLRRHHDDARDVRPLPGSTVPGFPIAERDARRRKPAAAGPFPCAGPFATGPQRASAAQPRQSETAVLALRTAQRSKGKQ